MPSRGDARCWWLFPKSGNSTVSVEEQHSRLELGAGKDEVPLGGMILPLTAQPRCCVYLCLLGNG